MERVFSLTRGEIDLETGRFPLTLFTNGPANGDPHIVDVATLETPERATMFVNHVADPTLRAGGIVDFRKVGKRTVLGGGKLKAVGIIDMQGDGINPDRRRDLAQGIHVGDVTQMSGRWDGGEAIPRASLKKSHYAYLEALDSWETPTFYKGSHVVEGSIVGVASDQAAMIGRSRDLSKPEHVREFWRALAHGGEPAASATADAMRDESQPIGDDWEEITLEGGARVFVPREVAAVYGQSIESGDDPLAERFALPATEMIRALTKPLADEMKDREEADKNRSVEQPDSEEPAVDSSQKAQQVSELLANLDRASAKLAGDLEERLCRDLGLVL